MIISAIFLGIRNVAQGEQAHLGQGIEAGTDLFNRREFKAKMAHLIPETSRFCPVLTLDVVHHRAFAPGQQGGNYQADAFAAAGRGES